MDIILGLMTFFFSIILIVSIILLIWDKFFKTDENTKELHNIMSESEESMEDGHAEGGNALIKESEPIIKENEILDEYELVEVHKRR